VGLGVGVGVGLVVGLGAGTWFGGAVGAAQPMAKIRKSKTKMMKNTPMAINTYLFMFILYYITRQILLEVNNRDCLSTLSPYQGEGEDFRREASAPLKLPIIGANCLARGWLFGATARFWDSLIVTLE